MADMRWVLVVAVLAAAAGVWFGLAVAKQPCYSPVVPAAPAHVVIRAGSTAIERALQREGTITDQNPTNAAPCAP